MMKRKIEMSETRKNVPVPLVLVVWLQCKSNHDVTGLLTSQTASTVHCTVSMEPWESSARHGQGHDVWSISRHIA